MNEIILSVLSLLACVNGQVDTLCNDKYCLYYGGTVSGPNSIENARTLCSQIDRNGWLLEVYDEQVSQLVDQFVYHNKIYNNSVLLNAGTITGSWNWINKRPFSNPDSIAFQSEGGEVSHAVYSATNKKIDYSSEHIYRRVPAMICQTNSNSVNCSKDQGLYYNKSCYILLYGASLWFEAQNECIKAGGSLAVLDGFDLNNVSKSWIQKLGDTKHWIGLTRIHVVWNKTNISVDYTKWKGGTQPYTLSQDMFEQTTFSADKCIVMNTFDNNSWTNVPCGQPFTVICMKEEYTTPPDTTMATSNPFNSNSDKGFLAPLVVGWVLAGIFLIAFLASAVCIAKLRRYFSSFNVVNKIHYQFLYLKSIEKIMTSGEKKNQMTSSAEPVTTYTSINYENEDNNSNINRDYQSLGLNP